MIDDINIEAESHKRHEVGGAPVFDFEPGWLRRMLGMKDGL